ncbi:MAG: hypothetical protein Fur0042_18220 [Cyanophyceae cyanobacterium]
MVTTTTSTAASPPSVSQTPAAASGPRIAWEKLPDDFVLPDDPVDNIAQPAIAQALSDALEQGGHLPAGALAPTNYGLCATVNDRLAIKAPDWVYIPAVTVPLTDIERSYTPHLQGEPPLIVLEFLSATEGDEYSVRPSHPLGKWYFYEQVLRVPVYGLFDVAAGTLEVYRLGDDGRYQPLPPQTPEEGAGDRVWIEELGLWLGVWTGQRQNRTGPWLRWWTEAGDLLLWGTEQAALERERAESERERADAAIARAERLAELLRQQGIDPEA